MNQNTIFNDFKKDILLKERDNKTLIYLYPYKDRAWVAYGQSATNLNRLLPHISMIEFTIERFEAVMVVDSLSLEWLLVKLPPLNRSEKAILLQMPEELLNVRSETLYK